MRILLTCRRAAVAALFADGLSLFTAAVSHAQAPQPETLTGSVKSDSGVAIPNASITVTPAGAGFAAAVTVRSNADGRWSATVPTRAAEYNVTVSAIGWIQARTTAKSADAGATVPTVVDVVLKKSAVRLNAVRVTAQRRQPPPRDFIGPDVAGTEKGILASSEVFAAADQGDLTAMIAQVPGITMTSDATSGLP